MGLKAKFKEKISEFRRRREEERLQGQIEKGAFEQAYKTEGRKQARKKGIAEARALARNKPSKRSGGIVSTVRSSRIASAFKGYKPDNSMMFGSYLSDYDVKKKRSKRKKKRKKRR